MGIGRIENLVFFFFVFFFFWGGGGMFKYTKSQIQVVVGQVNRKHVDLLLCLTICVRLKSKIHLIFLIMYI